MEQNLRVEGKSTAEPKTMHIGRNAEIDFMRIFMAFVIMMHHSNKMRPPDPERSPFIGGYLAVEFFFMLSGYFAVERTIKSNNLSYRNALLWTLKKYTKFFPYVFLAVMIGYGVNAYIAQMTLYDTLKAFTYSIFEILLLPMSGMYETLIVGQLWYLSALLIVLPLFYAALVKNEEFFLYIGCPLSAVLIYGCYSVTASHIDQWSGWLGFCYQALPRAWAGICLGGVVYLMKETIIKYENTLSNVGKHLLSILEAASLVFVILCMYTRRRSRLDFICIGLFVIIICIAVSRQASIHRIFPAAISKFSEFSVALYVVHVTVTSVVSNIIMPSAPYEERLPVYIILSLLYALGLMLIVFGIRRLDLPARFKRWILIK